MGFRNYIGVMDKKKHGTIKDMTIPQLKKWYGDDYVPCYKLTNELYEIGKYWDHSFLKPHITKVFSKRNTNKYYEEDHEFFLISKEGFEIIIDSYRKKVRDYYKSILEPTEKDKLLYNIPTPEQAIKNKYETWGKNCEKFKIFPYSTKGDQITDSWEYEYSIFELVRIYKTIKWNKQLVTITGW